MPDQAEASELLVLPGARHVVWAELHHDLLATLGRDRLGERQNRQSD